jgi:hypothetical protein
MRIAHVASPACSPLQDPQAQRPTSSSSLAPSFSRSFASSVCSYCPRTTSPKSAQNALQRTRDKLPQLASGFVHTLIWGLNVLYTPITISVLSKFVCTHEPIDGQFYQYHNPWQLCSAFDNAVAQPVYALSIAFYTIGILLLFAAIAAKYRMIRAANDEAGCMHLRSLFGSIMQSCREEYHWWEVVAICRRFFICASAALLSSRVDALTLSIFAILSVSVVVHVRSYPFMFPLRNSLETANLPMVMFNYLAGILFNSNLLSNFYGMDLFVVTVNCAAILLMFVAACWVWKIAPDLSHKLGVSQHLLRPTVLSKLSQRFTVANSTDIEMYKTAAATDALPTAATLASNVPNVPFDLLPQRCQAQLHLPNMPPIPPPHAHAVALDTV